jgi:hypothetical protein
VEVKNMSCGCSKNAESCGCGSKVMNWESYDRPSKTMMAEHDVEILYERWKDGELTDEETLSLIDMLITHDRKKLSHMIRWIQDENSEGMSNLRMGIKERYGWEKMGAEEPTVQEPDFMPNGDGRAIGQQNFAINLSPLHAETYEAPLRSANEMKEQSLRIKNARYTQERVNEVVEEMLEYISQRIDEQTAKGQGYFRFDQHREFLNWKSPLNQFLDGEEDEKHAKLVHKVLINRLKEAGYKVHARYNYDKDGQWITQITWSGSSFDAESFNAEGEMIKVSATLTPDFWEDIMNGDESINEVDWEIESAESFNAESKSKMTTSSGQTFYTTGKNVGMYGGNASSGEIAFYQGLPELKRTLSTLSSLDGVNRGIVVDFVNEWKDGSTSNLWDACQDLWAGAKGEDHFTEKTPNWKRADSVGTPSPNFNEGITGQDGPSADPTNSNFSAETFEAMSRYAPSKSDVDAARRKIKAHSSWGEVVYDRYLVNQQGSSNKFYYTAIAEKDGRFYPLGAWGRIGYMNTVNIFNALGKKENPSAHLPTMKGAYNVVKDKEMSKINARKSEKRYVDSTLTKWDAESLEEIEGPTAEATAGGLHSPSSFDMTWEDGTGQSSASIPPNEIAWAENTGFPTWAKLGAGIAVLYGVGKVITARVSEQKSADNAVKARKGCCGKSAESKTVRKNSEYSVGQINPVVVEGESDVHGAEEVKLSKPHQGPQSTHYSNERPSQKMW